jgi:hypothetical protein
MNSQSNGSDNNSSIYEDDSFSKARESEIGSDDGDNDDEGDESSSNDSDFSLQHQKQSWSFLVGNDAGSCTV